MLRGLEILEVLAGMEQPASLSRVAARAGFNEAAAYRTLRRLEAQGYIDHAPRTGYRVGSRSIALAALVGPDPPILRASHRALTRLVTTTGHSAALHLRSGEHRVLTVGIPAPSHPLRGQVSLGERAPLTSGSAGLVILAHLPESETEAILAAHPGDGNRPSPAELEQIRDTGYMISRRGNRGSLRGVSAPVLDPESGTPLGSITIAALDADVTTETLTQAAPILKRVCDELGAQLAALLGPSAERGRKGLDVTVRWPD